MYVFFLSVGRNHNRIRKTLVKIGQQATGNIKKNNMEHGRKRGDRLSMPKP